MLIRLQSNRTGSIKQTKAGFSWTVLFFGFLVPLFRGDFKWAAIMFTSLFIAGMVFFPIATFITIGWAFMYNKLFIQDLINKGYEPMDEGDAKVLNNYIA